MRTDEATACEAGGDASDAGRPHERLDLSVACAWLVAVAAGVLATFGVADSDFFWHLENGYEILLSGAIPTTDVYSYTARGAYYAYYSWLAEACAAALHLVGGVKLVVLAKAALCAAGFYLLWVASRIRGARGVSIAWALLFGLLLVRFRLYARPEIFTLVFLVVLDILVNDYFRRGRRANLVALPVLACLWANLHPYVLVGMGVLAFHVVGEFLGRASGRPTAGGAGRASSLAVAALAAFAATLLNPFGYRIYTPALKLFGSDAIASMPTREWLPPTFEGFTLFFIAAPLATAVVLVTSRQARLQDLAIWGVTLVGALASLRNIGIFAVCSTPILARHFALAADSLREPVRRQAPLLSRAFSGRIVAATFTVALVVCTATLLSPDWSILHQDQSRHYRFGAGLARYSAPMAAVDFVESRALEGPVYNSWAFGGYLIWRSWPRLEVSLDGRQMLYESFIADLRNHGPTSILDHLGVRLGLVEFHDEGSIAAFRAAGGYELVFFDDLSMVFLRADAVADDTPPYHLLVPEDLSMSWLHDAGEELLAAAIEEAERAIEQAPDCSRAWMMLGSLARRAGDLPRSTAALTRAIELDPTQKGYHNNLGIAYLESGRAADALESFRASISLDPRAFPAHYNSGLALLELGEARRAERSFRRAAGRDPARPEVHLMLGALETNPERARKHLDQVLASGNPEMTAKARALLRDLRGNDL